MGTATAPVSRLSEYETIYILRPNLPSDDAEKVSDRVSDVITRMGGKLTKVDNWGRRRLAYPIAGHGRGQFIYVRYLGAGGLTSELERNLRIADSVIRFLTVKLQDGVNADEIEVDPEQVKFLAVEPPEDEEPEPTLEQTLGMSPPMRSRRIEEEDFDSDADEEEEE